MTADGGMRLAIRNFASILETRAVLDSSLLALDVCLFIPSAIEIFAIVSEERNAKTSAATTSVSVAPSVPGVEKTRPTNPQIEFFDVNRLFF